MGPRLVAVTRVKNEVDVIESFIRHHSVYFDYILVNDDGSTDGTYERLCALRDEGLPIQIGRSMSIGHSQAEDVTRLVRLAVDNYAADWIFPLDADEFVEPPEGLDVKQILADEPPRLLNIAWSAFPWKCPSIGETEAAPVYRLTLRQRSRVDMLKIIIPALIARQSGFRVTIGNHAVTLNDIPTPADFFDKVELCHFPIRNREQYLSKMTLGYLQHRASPSFSDSLGFQYKEPVAAIKNNLDVIEDLMGRQSRQYSVEPDTEIDESTRDAPLRYVGGPLKYSADSRSAMANILDFVEQMAFSHARQKRNEAEINSALVVLTPVLSDAAPVDRIRAIGGVVEASEGMVMTLERQLSMQRDDLAGAAVAIQRLERRCEDLERICEKSREVSDIALEDAARAHAHSAELAFLAESLKEQLDDARRDLETAGVVNERYSHELNRPLVRLSRWAHQKMSTAPSNPD